jgi:hypothetical protein
MSKQKNSSSDEDLISRYVFMLEEVYVVAVNENYLNTIELFQHLKGELPKIPQET